MSARTDVVRRRMVARQEHRATMREIRLRIETNQRRNQEMVDQFYKWAEDRHRSEVEDFKAAGWIILVALLIVVGLVLLFAWLAS